MAIQPVTAKLLAGTIMAQTGTHGAIAQDLDLHLMIMRERDTPEVGPIPEDLQKKAGIMMTMNILPADVHPFPHQKLLRLQLHHPMETEKTNLLIQAMAAGLTLLKAGNIAVRGQSQVLPLKFANLLCIKMANKVVQELKLMTDMSIK